MFEFSFDDIASDSSDSEGPSQTFSKAISDQRQGEPTRTTRSEGSNANQGINVFNWSELLQGGPLYGDGADVLGVVNNYMGGLLSGALGIEGNTTETLGGGFDNLVPEDLKSKAKQLRAAGVGKGIGIRSSPTVEIPSTSTPAPGAAPGTPVAPGTIPNANIYNGGMTDWLPGYEKIPITGSAGNYAEGYNWKIVLHSTEYGPIESVVRQFQGQPGACPHFMIDPKPGGRRIQFIPLSMASCALKGGRNGYETNRGRAIQLEIVGKADEAEGWDDAILNNIAIWVADVAGAVPINLDNVATDDRGGTYAVENSVFRMAPEVWKTFDGIADHAAVPFNDHYDIARGKKALIAAKAKALRGQSGGGNIWSKVTG